MKPFLNNFLNIFHFRRQTVFFAVLGAVFVLIAVLVLPNRALADFSIVDDIVVPAAGFVASVFFSLLGKLLSAIISALIQIAKYNHIIDQPTVQSTWVIMRDFVNMFFVFALLLIAFSTILRLRQYEAKQLLPKLVLYAVLVNFSLEICGLFIDIAQVVMMTFVNAFEGSALNNLTSMTGLLDYGNLQLDTGTANSGEVLAGYILAIAFMVVAIITIGAMMVILLIRILMLWILAILSPFVFVLPVIPGGQKYVGSWWSMFSNYVISGPLLAFFIWLALTVVGQNTSIGQDIIQDGGVTIVKTTVGNSGFFINFLIAIGMLFAGLMLTSQLGGAMGKIAGGAASKMQGVATGIATGRIGPTPMRWARERYQSYRGQRESIRKESAQRFGQGVSAIQDRQINTRVGGLMRGTLGRATGAITGGRWVAGEAGQVRAQTRVADYREKRTADNLRTHAKAQNLSNQSDQQLRDMHANNTLSELHRTAITDELNKRGALGRERGDDQMAINARQYLNQAPETLQRFDDTLKTRNAELALHTIYRDPRTNNVDTDRVISDLNSGKLRPSSLNRNMIQALDAQLGRDGAFGEQWTQSMVDPKEIREKLKGMEEGVLESMSVGMNISNQTLDRRMAFGEASGNWHQVFDVNNADAHTAAIAENEFRNFMATGKNRKMYYENGSEGALGNETFWNAVHGDRRLGPTENQLRNILEDPQRRNAVNAANANIVNAANTVNLAGQRNHSVSANRARNLQVEISGGNALRDANGNVQTDGGGNVIEIYNINDVDPTAAGAAHAAMVEAIGAGRLRVEDFKNEDAITATPQLNEVLSQFSNEQLAKLGQDNKALVQNLITHWHANQALRPELTQRLDRLRSDHRYTGYNIPNP